MLGSRVEVPVVAVSPSALVRFPFLRWLREGARALIPHRHPLVSRYSWQVLGPREICLCSSGTRALQELSVWGALSLLFLLQKHQRRPKKSCHTQCCAILDCVSLRWLWGYVSTPNGVFFCFVLFLIILEALFVFTKWLLTKISLHICMCNVWIKKQLSMV